MKTFKRKELSRLYIILLTASTICLAVLASSCRLQARIQPVTSGLPVSVSSADSAKISIDSINSDVSSTSPSITGGETESSLLQSSEPEASSIAAASSSETAISKAASTPTPVPKYNKADLPIVLYKDSDDPLEVIKELIDRTNRCPMKSLRLARGYMEESAVIRLQDYKSYGTVMLLNIGVDPQDRLIKNHQFAETRRDQTKTELYRGIELEGKYFTSLDPDKVFHSVTQSEYKKIYDFYDSTALLDFDLPLSNEIGEIEFNNYKDTVSKYPIIIKIKLNKNYFDRKFDYYKSRILQPTPSDITFTDGKITIYANKNGILVTYIEMVNYTYKLNYGGLMKANGMIEFSCTEAANYQPFTDEFRTEVLDFVKTIK